ncbi:MAG: type II toxin-antitoxin system RelE/ParE family toxin [Acidimicrobiales bacterium]
MLDDLRALARFDEALIDAALQAITDLAEHRKVGKPLGERHVSGDLTGCRRLRFDLAGSKPVRFRVVYRLRPDEINSDTVEVIAVGPRGGHAAYQAAVSRLGQD